MVGTEIAQLRQLSYGDGFGVVQFQVIQHAFQLIRGGVSRGRPSGILKQKKQSIQQGGLYRQLIAEFLSRIAVGCLTEAVQKGTVARVRRRNSTGNGQLLIGKGCQIPGGAKIGGVAAQKTQVEDIGFRGKAFAFQGDSVKQLRRYENQISFVCLVVRQVDLIDAAASGNQGQLCLFVPVEGDAGVSRVKDGAVPLHREEAFAVPGVFLLSGGKGLCHGQHLQ